MIPPLLQDLFPDIDPASTPFLSFLEQFHEGVVIADCQGKILYVNDAQSHIDDLPADKLIGRFVTDIYRVDNDDTPVIKCVQTDRAVLNFTCYYRTRLGKIVNSIHNVYPLRSKDKMIGVICFVRDYSTARNSFEEIYQPDAPKKIRTFDTPAPLHRDKNLDNGTRFTFKDLIGNSAELVKAVSAARIASDSPSSVMLNGETGTGKELLAQSIHNNSPRKSRQFVAINCAAIPEHLLEGILFGTSKGAFTGALDKPGIFEQADGGTLFLDEINSMPLGLQAKLLRVIQERKIRRIGSLREIDMNIRIISSVNEDPHLAVSRGALRKDLLYRIGVLIIRIPPLRERMEDLEKLIRHFLYKYNLVLNKNINAISADVMDLFHNYQWPGNVRELEHVIEGAVNLARDKTVIEIRHLPTIIWQADDDLKRSSKTSFPPAKTVGNTTASGEPLNVIFPSDSAQEDVQVSSLVKIQAQNEIRTIKKALTLFQGNVSRAAKKLDLSPQLLHYKMKKYNIARKDFIP
ncbi:sigma-54 interaction domain-containing protein [Desulforhopalus singaporensis]|uniref:Arginine utilization regulatory protein n=1 Tax=Desulforhopalus singaporensis TaxID=91360 RepID=A0A1H0U278_9BACT|nr:sigma 54-interacting transcriptional regulator [Desulforhopalus singaporensis]SDP60303.1 arginine utilization regulatory protein [Desulforhopalus singaporensis]